MALHASSRRLTGTRSPQSAQAARAPFARAVSLDSPGAAVRNVSAFSMLHKQNLMGGSPRMIENQENFGANLGLLVFVQIDLIVKEKALCKTCCEIII